MGDFMEKIFDEISDTDSDDSDGSDFYEDGRNDTHHKELIHDTSNVMLPSNVKTPGYTSTILDSKSCDVILSSITPASATVLGTTDIPASIGPDVNKKVNNGVYVKIPRMVTSPVNVNDDGLTSPQGTDTEGPTRSDIEDVLDEASEQVVHEQDRIINIIVPLIGRCVVPLNQSMQKLYILSQYFYKFREATASMITCSNGYIQTELKLHLNVFDVNFRDLSGALEDIYTLLSNQDSRYWVEERRCIRDTIYSCRASCLWLQKMITVIKIIPTSESEKTTFDNIEGTSDDVTVSLTWRHKPSLPLGELLETYTRVFVVHFRKDILNDINKEVKNERKPLVPMVAIDANMAVGNVSSLPLDAYAYVKCCKYERSYTKYDMKVTMLSEKLHETCAEVQKSISYLFLSFVYPELSKPLVFCEEQVVKEDAQIANERESLSEKGSSSETDGMSSTIGRNVTLIAGTVRDKLAAHVGQCANTIHKHVPEKVQQHVVVRKLVNVTDSARDLCRRHPYWAGIPISMLCFTYVILF